MKVLIICNLFPPFVMGGAEMAAHSLAVWLSEHGHDVRVLTSAPEPADEGTEVFPNGLTVERRHFANVYQIYKAPRGPLLAKVRWHLKDHFHPESERICGEVMDDFQPDVVNTHDLQGIGYNLLNAIGARDVPCIQTLHDFGFMCLSMNMFRDGHECGHHHLPCVASTLIKRSYFKHIRTLAFISPTAALLERHRPHLPPGAETHVIPYVLSFEPTRPVPVTGEAAAMLDDGRVKLIYVGQLEPWKGVEFLISLLEGLLDTVRFHLTIVGGGSLLDTLQRRAANVDWLAVVGKVPPANVGGYMSRSDLLIVPSLWFENAPLVISQAVELGLPVLASNTGGLPEMITDGVNGALLPRGERAAWQAALERVCREPGQLEAWRAGAAERRSSILPDGPGENTVSVFRSVSAGRGVGESVATGGISS